jgi:hypothetical protein
MKTSIVAEPRVTWAHKLKTGKLKAEKIKASKKGDNVHSHLEKIFTDIDDSEEENME